MFELRVVVEWEPALDCQDIALAIGDEVSLEAGSDVMLVVDLGPHLKHRVVVGWRAPDGIVDELTLPAAVFRFLKSGAPRP